MTHDLCDSDENLAFYYNSEIRLKITEYNGVSTMSYHAN